MLLLGFLTYVPILMKIDQEMRPWECSQTARQIHTHRDVKRFYNVSHATFYSHMGQIIRLNIIIEWCPTKQFVASQRFYRAAWNADAV